MIYGGICGRVLCGRNSCAQQTIKYFLFYLVSILAMLPVAYAQVQFEDVTDSAGPFHTGESWGASWADFNNDGYPDITASNHRHRMSIWKNNGDGTFSDSLLQFDLNRVHLDDEHQDSHGVSWADVNNDGFKDLYVERSSEGSRGQLFLNNSGLGNEVGKSYGLGTGSNSNGIYGGRLGVFFDYNNDKLLDLFSASVSPIVMRNRGTSFENVTSSLYFSNVCMRANYIQFANLDQSQDELDFVCAPEGSYPERIYKIDGTRFIDMTKLMPKEANVNDTVYADFDNDGDVDMVSTKGSLRPAGASLVNPGQIEAWIETGNKTGRKGFTFSANGPISLDNISIGYVNDPLTRVFIGWSGYKPTSFPFTLDPNSSSSRNIKNSGTEGVYVGYNTSTRLWTVLLEPYGNATAYVSIKGSGLSEPTMVNMSVPDLPVSLGYSENLINGFEKRYGQGLIDEISCVSVVAGDFDNDMDIDIYAACRRGVENLPNEIYWNNGYAKFTRGSNHGAQGPVGAGLDSQVGVAESVVVADYDVDGFLDFFLTNGLLLEPRNIGGSDALIHNKGNNNHWIELDLVGVNVNRDAVGASVYATTGGVVQLREQNGGYHRWSQNDQRIHFGLGINETVDIMVRWPDGSVDEYNGLQANNVYSVTQFGDASIKNVGQVFEYAKAQPGDECGEPSYNPALDKGIFLYKNCSTGVWTMRATAGGTDVVNHQGSIDSNQPLGSFSVYSLENYDSVLNSPLDKIDFSLATKGVGEDGFNFKLASDARGCFSLNVAGSSKVYLGSKHLPAQMPLNLQNLGECVTLSAQDIQVSEGVGEALVELQLSPAAYQKTTVYYEMISDSATADKDFSSQSGSVVIEAGQKNATIKIPILQDSLVEVQEKFIVKLTSDDVKLETSTVNITINDDDEPQENCGDPAINPTTDRGIFLWRDCIVDNKYHLTVAGGGLDKTSYVGRILSDTAASSINSVSFEGTDFIEESQSGVIDYMMTVANAGQDTVIVDMNGDNVCIYLDQPAATPIYVGESRLAISSPFNIQTLEPCSTNLISSSDINVYELEAKAVINLELASVSNQDVQVTYQTAPGSALAVSDYISQTGVATIVAGQLSTQVVIDLVNDGAAEGEEVFNLVLTDPVNAQLINNSITITILAEMDARCQAPSIDPNTDQGLYIWQNCDSDKIWNVNLISSFGSSRITFAGEIETFDKITDIKTQSFEANDILGNSQANKLEFVMNASNGYADKFSFQVNAGGVCLKLTDPNNGDVYVGKQKLKVSAPVDIKTLLNCSNLPVNTAPVLVQPADQVQLLNTEVNLQLSATDIDGDLLTFTATGLPEGITIDANTGLISGKATKITNTIVNISVSDGVSSDSHVIIWAVKTSLNDSPLVDAGQDATVLVGKKIKLSATVTDDGFPLTPGMVTSEWTIVSGAGAVTFEDVSKPTSEVTFNSPGTYVLRLTASDGQKSDSDEVTFFVQDPVPQCMVEDFENGAGNWTRLSSSTCTTGQFVLGTPSQEISNGRIIQVGGDHTSGSGNALFTGINASLGDGDVDNGTCLVQSPVYEVSKFSEVVIWYFHGQQDTGDDSTDGFKLEYSLDGGLSWKLWIHEGDISQEARWKKTNIPVQAGVKLVLRVSVTDGNSNGDLIEGGIDDFSICSV